MKGAEVATLGTDDRGRRSRTWRFEMQGTASPEESEVTPAAKIIEIESGGPDVFSTLEDIAQHPAKTWTARTLPKDAGPDEWVVSENIAGVVEYVEDRQSEYGTYKMAELRLRSGERVQAHLFGTVLGKWGPILRVGDGVAIAYRGTRASTTPGRQDYVDFEVIVVRDGRRVSPAQVLGQDDEPVFEEGDGGLPMNVDG